MTNRTSPHRLAGTAIAAFLALSSTLVLAQEAPADVPVASAVLQPAPTIVLPPIVAQSVPAPATDPASPTVEAPTSRAADPKVGRSRIGAASKPVAAQVPRTSARAVAPLAAEANTPRAEVAAVIPVPDPNALPADLAGPQVASSQPASSEGSNDLLLAGLAGALGLGAIGVFAATRRRRPIVADDSQDVYEPVSEPASIVPQRNATLVSPAFSPLPAWREPRAPLVQPAESRALNLNRTALIDRMVAAEPDTNNPFTSGKARRRRARLMLQSMENNRWEDAELVAGFDWREMAQAVEQRETVDA